MPILHMNANEPGHVTPIVQLGPKTLGSCIGLGPLFWLSVLRLQSFLAVQDVHKVLDVVELLSVWPFLVFEVTQAYYSNQKWVFMHTKPYYC